MTVKGIKFFQFYSDGIANDLNIVHWEISKENSDLIANTIKTFQNHFSILNIKGLNSLNNLILRIQKSKSKTGYPEHFKNSRYSE